MRLYNYNIVLLLKRLSLSIFLFFISRLFFYIFNYNLYTEIGLFELTKLFFYGLRFDLSVISYFNILFIIFHIIPWNKLYAKKSFQLILKGYFLITNLLLTIGNMADSIYFHFVQKRSTADVFKLIFTGDDFFILLPKFLSDYWYLLVLAVVFFIVMWGIYPKYNPSVNLNIGNKKIGGLKLAYELTIMLVFLGLSVLGARGGLQLKPLTIIDASKNVKAAHMPLVLNSIFTCMTTYNHKYLEERNYFSNEEATDYYSLIKDHSSDSLRFSNKNVVVILLESFSREYVGVLNNYSGYTPFIDSLSRHSLVFENAYSNGLRSIDAIPAIIAGLPTLMDDPFITSSYSTNNTKGLVEILNEQNYHTAFFHGGNKGTMNFDGFASYAGFNEYYGRDEYDNNKDYDGHWGIYDEPFLQYFAKKLNSFTQPFFAFEFTLSSHYPYHLPAHHQDKFPEGPLKIHRVVRYTDYSLKKFFETASKMGWYNNTIFVIAADHPAQSVIPNTTIDYENNDISVVDKQKMRYYKNTSGRYSIPLMIFVPNDTLMVGTSSKTVQQTDLFPTILDYLNYNEPVYAFGSSMISDSCEGIAVHYVNGLYQITSGDYCLLMDGKNSIYLYDNSKDPGHNNNLLNSNSKLSTKLDKIIKSIVQQYTSGMIRNKLVVEK